MQPLSTNQRVLMWLCVCLSEEGGKRSRYWEKWVHFVFFLSVVSILTFYVASSIAYFVTFSSDELKESLHGIYQATAVLTVLYMIFTALILRNKISTMFRKLEQIYKECV